MIRYGGIQNPVARRMLMGAFAILIYGLIFSAPAHAHRVTLFAWVEGDTVHSLSKFSGGRKVRKGKIIVYDTAGNQLLEGRTNDQGEFSFKTPTRKGLKIVLQAGMGHRAQWLISAEEMGGAPTQGESPPQSRLRPGRKRENSRGLGVPCEPSTKEIQRAVERALDKKLGPLIQRITESQQSGPSFKDVMGGLGYIFGLAGIAGYLYSRRERKNSPTP